MEGATPHWMEASGPQSLRTVAILGALMAFASISTDLYLPAMPSMAEALDTDACFACVAGSPFLYIAYLHVSPQWHAMLFAAGVSGIMLTNRINMQLQKRFSADALIRFGAGMAALAGAVAALDALEGWGGLGGVAVPLFFVVAANGFMSAHAIAGASSHFDEGAGAVSALLGSVQYGTGMVGFAPVGMFAGARSTLNGIAWMGVASMLCAWLFLPGRAGRRHTMTSPVRQR